LDINILNNFVHHLRVVDSLELLKVFQFFLTLLNYVTDCLSSVSTSCWSSASLRLVASHREVDIDFISEGIIECVLHNGSKVGHDVVLVEGSGFLLVIVIISKYVAASLVSFRAANDRITVNPGSLLDTATKNGTS